MSDEIQHDYVTDEEYMCSEDCFCHEGYDDSTPAQQARGLAFEESPYAEDCE
jgi:hypothetical protein